MPKKRKSRLNTKLILDPILVKCTRHDKVLHRDLETAKQQAKKYRKNVGSKMNIYECSVYEGWHIGHQRAHKGRKAGKLKFAFPRIK